MTIHDPHAETSSDDKGLRANQALAVLRAIPFGGADDSTSDLDLPPAVRASVSPAIATIRWGAATFGIAFAAPQAFRGSYLAVMTVAVCIFITTWRTVIPIRLGSTSWRDRVVALTDVFLLAVAVGLGGALESPFVFTVMTAMIVVAFGWGGMAGAAAFAVGAAGMVVALPLSPSTFGQQVDSQRDLALVLMVMFAVAAAAFIRQRLLDAEARRRDLTGELDALSDANDLLALVNGVARTLPTSLTLREALEASRHQIEQAFDARVVALLALDEHAEEWVPKLADGCVLNLGYTTPNLPPQFRETLESPEPQIRRLPETPNDVALTPSSRSSLSTSLRTRNTTVGLLILEHPDADHFEPRHLRMMSTMAEVLALTIDNARWFGRLRSLGAEEERVRLARDLHDRLGQWLTYIGFELERIMSLESAGTESTGELHHLYTDVQSALDELRETLRQLRSGVSDTQPLAVLGKEFVSNFSIRSGIAASFNVVNPDEKLPVPVENELFRILQEALNNVTKHSRATLVEVTWTVDGGNFELAVADDGRGFAAAHGVRDSAYGLVGMRERADVIGAEFSIESAPGEGTTLRVGAGRIRQRAKSRGVAADRNP